MGWKNIKAQCSLEAARQHDPVVLGGPGWSLRLTFRSLLGLPSTDAATDGAD